MRPLPGETREQRDARKSVEKPLADIAALLGQNLPETAATIACLRDLVSGASPSDAAYCLETIRRGIATGLDDALRACERRASSAPGPYDLCVLGCGHPAHTDECPEKIGGAS